jgi:pyruvate,water dikinase
VLKNLKDYVQQPDRDLPGDRARLAAERERLVAEARTALADQPPPVREQFEFLLRAAQAGAILTQEHEFWIDYGSVDRVRRVLRELGRRLAAAGSIDQPDDVFYLTLDELREAATSAPGHDRRPLVAARRAEIERFRAITPPAALGTPPPAQPDDPVSRALGKFFGAPPPRPPADAPVVRGLPASAGRARGRARVVGTLAEAGKLRRGDVLVARTTAPAWTPLFATVAAVVTDTGGALCHSAVVAREYRIPAVVGTGDATATLRDGELIEVDGTAGIVRRLEF